MGTGNAQDGEEGEEGEEDGFLSRWSRRKGQVRQGVALAEPPAPLTVLPRAVAPTAVQATPAPGGPAARPQPAAPGAEGVARAEPAPAITAPPATAPPAAAPPPAPTLADVAALTAESDYARFVAPGVDPGVKNAALKKLFTDPHFNLMDGLDTYIDDYGQPDPLPEGMLRQMAQSHALGLFADEAPAPLLPSSAPLPLLAPAAACPDTPAGPPDPPALTAPAAVLPADSPAYALAESPETLPPPKPPPDEDAALRLQPHDAAGPAGPGPGAGPHAGRQP